jgi:ABC-type uncharacterized transport system permease subunit
MELFTDVPRDLISILEATIIFFVAIEFSLAWLRRRQALPSEEREAEATP